MTEAQRAEPPSDLNQHQRETFHALIREQVLDADGEPGDLLGVRVHLLWENHYRVNVLVGPDAASARVASSYFLVTDTDGNVVASTPVLRKQTGWTG